MARTTFGSTRWRRIVCATLSLTWSAALPTACLLRGAPARADGGELTLGANYAPSLVLLRQGDAPFADKRLTPLFRHVLGLEASYALSHRVSVGFSGQFQWPQGLRARDVSWVDAGGQKKTQATVQLRELGLGGMLFAQLKTDRRQVWDLAFALGAGVQASRWRSSSFAVIRQANSIVVRDERTFWRVTPAYLASAAVSWRLHDRVELSVGPRLVVTQHGTLTLSAVAQLAVPLGVGPSW